MVKLLYFLPTQNVAQKFLNPENTNECVIFNDKAVWCPGNNPYQTDRGRISVSAVCQDCESFLDLYPSSNTLICEGKPKLIIKKNQLKEYLDPIEI